MVLAAFGDSAAADRAAAALGRSGRGGGPVMHGSATARWRVADDRPHWRTYSGDRAAGAVDPAFWGLLLGVALSLPLAAAARGTTGGSAAGLLTDVGVDDSLLNRLRDRVVPGRSALVALVPAASVRDIQDVLASLDAEVATVPVDVDGERALWTAFGP